MKPGCEVIEVNFEELAALKERARQGPLGEEDCQRLQSAIDVLSRLIDLIGDKDTTISRLRALLEKPSTEKTSKVLEQAGLGATSKGGSSPPASVECGTETRARPQWRGSVSGSTAHPDCARRVDSRGSLPALFEG